MEGHPQAREDLSKGLGDSKVQDFSVDWVPDLGLDPEFEARE